ncbi:MAG: hypothetical protein HS104_42085 [Polyangiaceae bacterium]|nr:hypothetical protein [Polyangiaceae bacterium]MCL4753226.1 hypothetical protein [Myxococcales bacterium]
MTSVRRGFLWILLCVIGACRSEAETTAGARAAAAIDAGDWSETPHCRTRLFIHARERFQYKDGPPSGRIIAGVGAGWFCLGDSIQLHADTLLFASHCSPPARGTAMCRLLSHGTDLTFTDRVLTKIRAHRPGRIPFGTLTPFGLTAPYFELSPGATAESVARAGFRLDSRTPVDDPEFGRLEVVDYDGLRIELETEGGGEIVGGVVVTSTARTR